MADKRIIEQVTSEEILNDDWLIKDSVTEGTTKVQPSTLKEYVNVGMATAQALLSETQERESNDETLSGRIAAETAARTNAVNSLSSIITSEATARENADSNIRRLLGDETTARTSGDNELSGRINSEVTARTNADLTLDNRITNEVNAREFADTSLSNRIDDLDFSANAISYDNSESGLDTTNVQDAIDEVLDKANKVDDIQTYGGNTLVTNKIADLSALTIKKDIPSTPTAIATFADGAEMVMPSLKVAIEPVQEGSGDPSPTNIRPISGWDEVNVNVSGTNIWDEEWEVGNIDNSTGLPIPSSNIIRAKNYINVAPNITFYCKYLAEEGNITVFYYDANKNFISLAYLRNIVGTTPNNCKYMRFKIASSYGTTYNNDISINYPSTDTSYHAYNGQTYTFDLDGTRYGGELDVVNGVLTVDRAYVDMGTLTWAYQSTPKIFNTNISGLKRSILMCSNYKYTDVNYVEQIHDGEIWDKNNAFGLTNVVVKDLRYTSASDFKTAMNGVQLVYELATPITIQLTPTAVKSLAGDNNVFADSGEILEGEYLADASTVIAGLDARITALENA